MLPIDVKYMFNNPEEYKLPSTEQYANNVEFPHLNSQDYATRIENRSLRLLEAWDSLSVNGKGEIVIATNKRDGREWRGSFFGFKNEHNVSAENAIYGIQRPALISKLQYSTDNLLLVALTTGSLEMWSTDVELKGATEKRINILRTSEDTQHKAPISQLSVWKHNRNKAVTACLDQTLNIWEISTGLECSYTAHVAHNAKITGLATSPNNEEHLVFCAQDGTVLLWDLRKERPAAALYEDPALSFTSISWNKRLNNKIYFGDNTGIVYTIDERMPKSLLESNRYFEDSVVTQLCVQDNKMAAIGNKPALLKVTELTEHKLLYESEVMEDRITDVAWTEQKALLTIGYNQVITIISHTEICKTAKLNNSV